MVPLWMDYLSILTISYSKGCRDGSRRALFVLREAKQVRSVR
ncbi:hypothetical protein J2X14_000955 [Pantoea alhagi]|nr:hypothetical protein [Pantoea alhagi]